MLIDRIRDFFRSPKKRRELAEKKNSEIKAISQQELASLKAAKDGHACGALGKCRPVHTARWSRATRCSAGALLATAVFGFPVFCLVCPVGLTFATVLVIWRAFAHGDATIGLILIPAMLVIELVVLRKWCSNFCPLSALMNLVGRFSRTFVPTINDEKCLETARATSCSKCAEVCDGRHQHPSSGIRSARHGRLHALPQLRGRVPHACHHDAGVRRQEGGQDGRGNSRSGHGRAGTEAGLATCWGGPRNP